MFDKEYWEDRYKAREHFHQWGPNPILIEEATKLAPGTALDAGCGEGSDAIWLSTHGWRATGLDLSATVLELAQKKDGAADVRWVEGDLADWVPLAGRFDLVTSHYTHPDGPYDRFFTTLASAVAPGGTLLIVGHDPEDFEHAEACFTADQVVAALDPAEWRIDVAESRAHEVAGHRLVDVVVRATRFSKEIEAAEGPAWHAGPSD
ncbi:hypothetical protein Acor_47730 [Acrocarpospora corrugata]|uniref:Methyltransferase domain-containing protein n=1 Tax=Acrocarpospora corrugata TaxID=35763 RepID=A0A5M3W0R5_9ACTN|nr:class I SAM-dependent methyltransferase [Acrocarpospora corrugata]GES02707.1 hypothetical protein Acor_47730 [Acrocarpospora corrugata]